MPEKLWFSERNVNPKTIQNINYCAFQSSNNHTIAGSVAQNQLESKEMKNEPKGADNTKSHQSERE